MHMKKNEGPVDRSMRAVIALIIFIAALLTYGALSTTLYVMSLLLILTAITGYCGLYQLMGITTCSLKAASEKAAAPVKKPARKKKKN